MADNSEFLLQPTAEITKDVVDFGVLGLPEYHGLYATVLDNCFTKAECDELVARAETHSDGVWEDAMINAGNGKQVMYKDARDCGRIIWDDKDMVQRIWNRVKDKVPEIEILSNMPRVTGNGPAKRTEIWKMSRLNERMRFLKYGKGQYFKSHMDGSYVTPSGEEISFYTLHLYLNDSKDDKIGGGATTFFSMNEKRKTEIKPKTGRVLIFQHRGLLHDGAEVTKGIKLTLRTDLMFKKVPK